MPLWVNGIPGRPGWDWRPYLGDQILGRMHLHPQGHATQAAEDGLVIEPAVYWFVGTASRAYAGHVLRSWTPNDLKSASGGLCPFDTGGLWLRKVVPEPPLGDDDEVRAYFAACDVPLTGWPGEVITAIDAAYNLREDYVCGLAPQTPMTPRDHSGNRDLRAWIWEARIAKNERIASFVDLERFYWREATRRRFFGWLNSYRGLNSGTRLHIGATAASRGYVVDDPVVALVDDLIRELSAA